MAVETRAPSVRNRLLWIALGLVVVVGVVVLIVGSGPDNSPAARTGRLEHELACPVCEGQSVADSESPQAQAIRAEIPTLIAQGMSDAQIRAYYVGKYQEKILETPSNSGIGIVAWAIPTLAIILGGAAIFVALRRWSRVPRLHATAEDEETVRRARERDARVLDADAEADDEVPR